MNNTIPDAQLFPRGYVTRLIVPLIIEQLLAVTIGLADTVMVTSSGEAAVSAVSLVDQINILLIQIFAALATGGAVVVSQYIGRGEGDYAKRSAKQLLYISTSVSLVISVLCLVFCRDILSLVFGTVEDGVMGNLRTYFYLSAASYPFLAVYNAGSALYRSMGKSRVTMYTSAGMNLMNICGNALFIYGLGMGVFGAGLASLLSRAAAGAVMLVLIQKKENLIYIEKPLKVRFEPAIIKRILAIGVPNGMENSMFQVGKLIVARFVSKMGTSAIAANAVGGVVVSLSNVPGMAIGLGLVTLVGQCMGAGRADEADKYAKKMLGLAFLLMNAINALLLILAPFIVMMFSLSGEAYADAVWIIRTFCAASVLFWPPAFTIPNCLRAAGDVKFTLVVSMVSMWVFRVGCCFVFCEGMKLGVHGVWYAMYVDWVFRAVLFTQRLLSGKWKKFRVV